MYFFTKNGLQFFTYSVALTKHHHQPILLNPWLEPASLLRSSTSPLRGSWYCPWDFAVRGNWVSSIHSVDAILEDVIVTETIVDAKILIQRLSSFCVPKIPGGPATQMLRCTHAWTSLLKLTPKHVLSFH